MILIAGIALLLGAFAHAYGIDVLTNTEGLIGSMLMMFSLLSILFAPLMLYTLNAELRYKRIVHYKSAEWKRLHK